SATVAGGATGRRCRGRKGGWKGVRVTFPARHVPAPGYARGKVTLTPFHLPPYPLPLPVAINHLPPHNWRLAASGCCRIRPGTRSGAARAVEPLPASRSASPRGPGRGAAV